MIDSRRKFIGTMATGLATTLASPKGVLGANDRIRMGIIGIGARGTELVHWALACPNLDFVAFAVDCQPVILNDIFDEVGA